MERLAEETVVAPKAKFPLPSGAVPSKNVTVPVAAKGETVAVKVTDRPKADGLILDVIEVLELTHRQSGSPGRTTNGK